MLHHRKHSEHLVTQQERKVVSKYLFSTHYPTRVYIFLFELCSQTESGIIKGSQLLPSHPSSRSLSCYGLLEGIALPLCWASPWKHFRFLCPACKAAAKQRKKGGLNGWLNGVLSVHFCWTDRRLWCVTSFIGSLSNNMHRVLNFEEICGLTGAEYEENNYKVGVRPS